MKQSPTYLIIIYIIIISSISIISVYSKECPILVCNAENTPCNTYTNTTNNVTYNGYCNPGLYCDNNSNTCKRQIAIGGTCVANGPFTQCVDEASCLRAINNTIYVCKAFGVVGEACDDDKGYRCAIGGVCRDHVCVDLLYKTPGQPCEGGVDYCTYAMKEITCPPDTNICPGNSTGQGCDPTSYFYCNDGLFCNATVGAGASVGVCTTQIDDEKSCSHDIECKSDECVANKCIGGYSQPAGAPCRSSSNCAPGYDCIAEKCTAHITPTYKTCANDSECATGERCYCYFNSHMQCYPEDPNYTVEQFPVAQKWDKCILSSPECYIGGSDPIMCVAKKCPVDFCAYMVSVNPQDLAYPCLNIFSKAYATVCTNLPTPTQPPTLSPTLSPNTTLSPTTPPTASPTPPPDNNKGNPATIAIIVIVVVVFVTAGVLGCLRHHKPMLFRNLFKNLFEKPTYDNASLLTTSGGAGGEDGDDEN